MTLLEQTIQLPAPEWHVLSEPSRPRPGERVWSVPRIAAQLAVAALAVLCAVVVVGSVVSARVAERQGVHDAAQTTDVLASGVITPALTDAMVTDAAATKPLDAVVRAGVLTNSLVRVKIWDRTGRIVYSDEPRLLGRAFPLDDEALRAFSGPSTYADVSDLNAPENVYERSQGKLLEVYRPIWTPSGVPLLFEAYYKYDIVTARANDLRRAYGGIMLSCLGAAFALLIPVAWALVQRARRAHQEREAMMTHAVEASHDERKRIAATLHDGVVQQLAAASFAVAGEAERATDPDQVGRLRATAETVRATMGGMRALLVDLYPASLRNGGLAPAMRDLAGTLNGIDAEVTVDVDTTVAELLRAEAQEAMFRVAQESLRNAAKHAGARQIGVLLAQVDGFARLEISDDGAGFTVDPAVRTPEEGHFGLELITDAARQAEATLSIGSMPGAGTVVRMDVPLP